MVLVDEYQDSDPAQESLLMALAGDGRELIAVGDPDQSIYAFRGADVRALTEFPDRFRTADGRYRWQLGRAYPRRDESGEIVEWVGTATDVDDAKRAEETERFLAEAGDALGSSLDYVVTLRAVAELAVPLIADWCRIDVLDDDGVPRLLAAVHVEPEKAALAEELQRRLPAGAGDETGPAAVVRSGNAELRETIRDDELVAAAQDETQLALLRELGFSSSMCVPLVSSRGALGTLTFVATTATRSYGEAELRLAEEIGRRAGLAMENALLYREAEERAQASRALATIADGVFLLDRDGVVRLWNPAAAAISGLRAEEVAGRLAAEAIPGWTAIAARIPIAESPGPVSAQTLPLELDGGERWLSIAGVGFEDGTVFTFRDLTEERVLEELRRDLVATVSHELRTPLAAIYGSALTLQREDVGSDEELRDQLLDVIASESGRRFGPDDLTLAEELARRAATAIENARLYREAEARAQAARVLATIGDGVG